MTYDDPSLREFRGYLAAKEPGRRERADAWATAKDETANPDPNLEEPDKGGHWEVVR